MKKLYTLVLALGLSYSSIHAQLTTTWEKLPGAAGYSTTWFSTTSGNNRTVAYNPVTNKLYVSNANDRIVIVDAATGDSTGVLANTTTPGIGTESFKFMKIRVTSTGQIFASNLATGAGNVIVYTWANEAAAPTIAITLAVGERTGDSFGLSGSGSNTVLYFSGSSNTKIYVCTTNNGTNFLNTSTITGIAANSASRSISPVTTGTSSELWIKASGSGVTAKRISSTGTVLATTTDGTGNGFVAGSFGIAQYIEAGAKKFLVSNGSNASGNGVETRVTEVTTETGGTGTPPAYIYTNYAVVNLSSTWNSNGNGTGDVAFKVNSNGTYTIYSMITNNGLAAYTTQYALPVSISSFSAAVANKKVQIKWSTSTEVNNSSFEVEKSVNGKDFSSIGRIASKAINGNSTSTLEYNFEDSKPFAGNNYYRLKQIDKDGKFNVSNTEVINFNNNQNFTVYVLQNPVKSAVQLNIKASANTILNVNIVNTLGQTVLSKQINVSTGENNISLDASSFTSGTYFIKVKDTKNNTTEQNITVLKN